MMIKESIKRYGMAAAAIALGAAGCLVFFLAWMKPMIDEAREIERLCSKPAAVSRTADQEEFCRRAHTSPIPFIFLGAL